MFYQPMLQPMLVMVGLTFLVWLYLFARRIPEILRKGVDPNELKNPEDSHRLLPGQRAASNNFRNLFELPVLYYAAVLLSVFLMVQDAVLITLSWGFVVFRVLHSAIHCSYNDVNHRFAAFAASSLFLLLLWLRLGAIILMR